MTPEPFEAPAARSTAIRRVDDGGFELLVEGEPFGVRGVAYALGSGWRAAKMPPTRRQLDDDFARIKAMGANTIRRYGTGWYDANILAAARDHDLKVMFGFWFRQDIDYLRDRAAVRAYVDEVLETVRARRDDPSIIAWVLGNEVWGLLKHHYAQPYLTEVRRAYVHFIEGLAREIHRIDPDRPVMTALEHTLYLPAALEDFSRMAPSIDAIGVNVYYEEHFSELKQMLHRFGPGRPYFVSEFGPDGYWHPRLSSRSGDGALVEASGRDKAEQYRRRWQRHATPDKDRLGGIAFVWRDRLEGTATWFGLTDYDGRAKPAYFALKDLWTGDGSWPPPISIDDILGPPGPYRPGETVTFSVAGVDSRCGAPRFEWSLKRDDIMENGGTLAPQGDGARVRVTLPRAPGSYRLYVHAVAPCDAVDTASRPLLVTGSSP